MHELINRVDGALFYKIVQLIFHVQFSQFGKAADPLTVDRDLRYRTCTAGDAGKLAARSHIGVDSYFIVGNVPLAEQ